MEEDATSHSSYRISGMPVHVGRVLSPSAHPGQNGSFSDGFLTKRRVEACDSEEPGKTTDPQNPMKSRDYTPSDGYPADPPVSSKRPAASCGPLCFRGPHCPRREWDENPAAGFGFERRSELGEQIQRPRSADWHGRRQSHSLRQFLQSGPQHPAGRFVFKGRIAQERVG
jgi:hypothetical protein